MYMPDLVNIGKVSGTHHLKGAIKVTSLLEDIDVLDGSKVIFQSKTGEKKLFTIKSAKPMNTKKIILDVEEIKNIDEARKYMGYELYIRRELLGEITEDSYYMIDLINMDVEDINGKKLGKLVDVNSSAAHDIYIVEGDREIMIPAVDQFVKKIDFEKRKIIVELIEGM